MDKKALGKRINITRKSRSLTSERLSELCEVNATYIRQIEAGQKTPSLPVFVDICNALEVSPTYLLMDMLGKNEMSQFDELSTLWSEAEPDQIRLVMAMLRCALEELQRE